MDSCRCHFLYAPAPLQLTTFYAILQLKTTCVCMTVIDIFYTIVIDNLSCTITINDFCMYYWNQQILYALMLLTIFFMLYCNLQHSYAQMYLQYHMLQKHHQDD